MNRFLACLTGGAMLACAGAAQATELRAGVLYHDFGGLDAGISGKEESVAITASVVSDKVRALPLMPAFELGGDLNFGGATSFLWFGSVLRLDFGTGDRFYFEYAPGLAIHDGELEIDDLEPGLTAEEAARRVFGNANNIEYGSRILFRNALGFGYRFTDQVAGEAYFEHFSHGKILSSRSNEGVDILGLRVSYTLD